MYSKACSLFCLCICLFSCNGNTVFSDYKATDNGYWPRDKAVVFQFSGMDTLETFNLFLNIRHDNTFPYSNIFLITELNFPDGETIKDTLEYEMALPDGQWLGKGNGSIKENKLWFKENVVFPSSGVYTLEISHAMRHLGNVEGLENVKGITDIGFQIEKSE